MKVNSKKLSALAAVGIVGLGMAGTPVMAADGFTEADGEGSSNVTYTSGAYPGDKDGNLLMIVPANTFLNQKKLSQEGQVLIRMADGSQDLPSNLNYDIDMKSQNGLKLKPDTGTVNVDYDVTLGTVKSADARVANPTDTPVDATMVNLLTANTYAQAVAQLDRVTDPDNPVIDGTPIEATKEHGTQMSHFFKAEISQDASDKLETTKGVDYKDVLTFKMSNVKGDGLQPLVKN